MDQNLTQSQNTELSQMSPRKQWRHLVLTEVVRIDPTIEGVDRLLLDAVEERCGHHDAEAGAREILKPEHGWALQRAIQRAIPWENLIATDQDGNSGTLGSIMADDKPLTATVRDGRITEWLNMFLSAPGETPDWDTPHANVDWTGFTEALSALEARAALR
jgi:hypothetical protein